MTIHNIAYQGNHAGAWLYEQSIPARNQPDLVYQDLTDNLLAIGIGYADQVTTVSPRYAIEIHYPYMGYGLDALINRRSKDLVGILNGIDTDYWNPDTDPVIATNYNADTFTERRPDNKRELQYRCQLPIREDIPIIGLVSRLDRQKGLDLAIPAMRSVLANAEVQFVGLGTGDPDLNHELWQMGQDFHWRARTFVEHNSNLAHLIYAGCDIFLMPSYYEPCGIGQMIAMRYGALPLVRETGGLADTVANYDNGQAEIGTGFMFNWTEVDALINTIYWALDTYHNRSIAWQRMQARAMHLDLSWQSSARQYVDLYRQIIVNSRGE
jgi:starch synthase